MINFREESLSHFECEFLLITKTCFKKQSLTVFSIISLGFDDRSLINVNDFVRILSESSSLVYKKNYQFEDNSFSCKD